MHNQNRDIRCEACGILLGKLDRTGLTIERGHLEANFDGVFRASIRCYRRGCSHLNVMKLSTATETEGAAA